MQRNPITSKEAEQVIDRLADCLSMDEEACGLFLRLLYAPANEHNEAERSAVYYSACQRFAYKVEGAAEVFEADHVRTLAKLREGGGPCRS